MVYISLLVLRGRWFQDPLMIPKSSVAQIFYINSLVGWAVCLVSKTLVRMPTFHIKVPGFNPWLQLLFLVFWTLGASSDDLSSWVSTTL